MQVLVTPAEALPALAYLSGEWRSEWEGLGGGQRGLLLT